MGKTLLFGPALQDFFILDQFIFFRADQIKADQGILIGNLPAGFFGPDFCLSYCRHDTFSFVALCHAAIIIQPYGKVKENLGEGKTKANKANDIVLTQIYG